MQNLFNSYTGPKQGLTIDPGWRYVRSGLQRNISQAVNYYRERNFSVKNSHLIVRFLNSCGVTTSDPIESFYNRMQDKALGLSMHFNMTSSIYKGDSFEGVFFGAGSKEVIIATDDSMNPFELEQNWQDIQAVTFLDHPKSDTSLLLANGKSYSAETGLSVIAINIPALLVQYRCWLKEQSENFKNGLATFPTPVFVHKYILPNMLYSQLDVALFNRLYNLAQGAPMGKPMYRHAFQLISYDDRVDKILKDIIKKLTRNDKDFFMMMREVPMIGVENLLELAKVPESTPTRQYIWAELLSRLKLIDFLIELSPSNGKKLNREELNFIKKYFDQADNANILSQCSDKGIVRDAEATMISIRATALKW